MRCRNRFYAACETCRCRLEFVDDNLHAALPLQVLKKLSTCVQYEARLRPTPIDDRSVGSVDHAAAAAAAPATTPASSCSLVPSRSVRKAIGILSVARLADRVHTKRRVDENRSSRGRGLRSEARSRRVRGRQRRHLFKERGQRTV